MAIRGSLREAGVGDVLQLLKLGRKSGVLTLSDGRGIGRIVLAGGWIRDAKVANRRDRLGALLRRDGIVSAESLAAALNEHADLPGRPLGEILVARGDLGSETLERYLRRQVEEAVHHLFTWREGVFHFGGGTLPGVGGLASLIDPEAVLLEAARRLDELEVMRGMIPSPETVFAAEPDASVADGAAFTPDQRLLLSLLGERSVRGLIEASGLSEFDGYRALHGLARAAVVREVGTAAVPGREESAEISGHRLIGIAFVAEAMIEEAEGEFRRILDLAPADLDARFRMAAVLLRRGDSRAAIRELMHLIELGGRWPSSFHNLGLALEAEGRLVDALAVVDEGLRIDPSHGALSLSRGILLTRLGRFEAAARAFDAGLAPGTPSQAFADLHLFAPLAYAGAGEERRAREAVAAGAAAFPHDADIAANGAAVLAWLGDPEAERAYRRALAIDPSHAQARFGLAETLGRRRGATVEKSARLPRASELRAVSQDVFPAGNGVAIGAQHARSSAPSARVESGRTHAASSPAREAGS